MLSELLQRLERAENPENLLKSQHGIERETLRVNGDGTLALSPHPKNLSDPLTDPEITTDFSESQLELITRPHDSAVEAVDDLEKIHKRVWGGLAEGELLWPNSMPGILPSLAEIPVAEYGDSPEAKVKETYRRGLALRYGKYIQMLSGVHYNVSFTDQLWDWLCQQRGCTSDPQSFKNEMSLGLVRNFIRQRWFLSYLLGATPIRHQTFDCPKLTCFEMASSISLRSSRCGYHNPEAVRIDYNNFSDHLDSIDHALNTPYPPYTKLGLEKEELPSQLNDHLLQIPNEYYFPIRMKPAPGADNFFVGLKETGVSYFELRLLDIDPHQPTGVDVRALHLSHLFLLHCLLTDSPNISWAEYQGADQTQQDVVVQGRKGLPAALKSIGENIFESLSALAALLGGDYPDTIEYYQAEFKNPQNLPWKKMLDEMESQKLDFIDYSLSKTEQHQKTF